MSAVLKVIMILAFLLSATQGLGLVYCVVRAFKARLTAKCDMYATAGGKCLAKGIASLVVGLVIFFVIR